MATVHTLVLGSYQTNCYIVEGPESRCVIIDPGYEPDTILDFLAKRGLTAEAILLTHGHFDHVGAVKKLVEKIGCKLWMSEDDWSQKASPITAYFYPIAGYTFPEVHFCQDGKSINAAGLTFAVLATPGHTQGSVCYLCDDAVFSGDTLFAGSCGRTDLPGGDWAALFRSLKQLASLPRNYIVYPGHGESTTLDAEKQYNPYMQ